MVANNIQISTAAAVDFWTLVLNDYWHLAKFKIRKPAAAAVEFWILVLILKKNTLKRKSQPKVADQENNKICEIDIRLTFRGRAGGVHLS